LPNLILRLALPSPLRRLFDYLAPAGVSRSALQPGVRLRVPFGRREMIGVLVEVDSQSDVPPTNSSPPWNCSTPAHRCQRRCSSCACGLRSTISTALATP
jgi:hypothetical protein